MNVENLTILANYLDTVSQVNFDMRTFSRDQDGDDIPLEAHECGTVGCAIGHGPDAGLPFEPQDIGDWVGYGERVFGLGTKNPGWDWCFSASWAWIDNSPAGAAKRIRHLIEHGVPSDALGQRLGNNYLFAIPRAA
jgi:hypothetical protein